MAPALPSGQNAWVGQAPAVAQKTTIVMSGSGSTGQTIILDIDGTFSLTYTIGTTATNAQIADDLAVVISGSGSLGAAATTSAYGNVSGPWQFMQTVASDSTDTVTLTGKADGRPFTVSDSGTFAGTVTITNTVTAQGPYDAGDAENWLNGVPTSTDEVIFDSRGQTAVKYNLDDLAAVVPSDIYFDLSYEKQIGLPDINTEGTYPFAETLQTFFDLGATGSINATVGQGKGNGSSMIRWNSGAGNCTIIVNNTGAAGFGQNAAFEWIGTGTNTMTIRKGSVGIASRPGDAATIGTIRVQWTTSKLGDVKLYVGEDVTNTTFVQTGGETVSQSALGTTTCTIEGGTVWQYAGAQTALTIRDALYHHISAGTITDSTVYANGTLSRELDSRSCTISELEMYAGATFKDPNGSCTLSDGINLNACSLGDVTLELPTNRKISIAAIS